MVPFKQNQLYCHMFCYIMLSCVYCFPREVMVDYRNW